MKYFSSATDYFYDAGDIMTLFGYYIMCDGITIYNGVAFKGPKEQTLRINIGRRVSDYLTASMPDFREFDGVVVPHPEQIKDFELYDAEGTLLETYRVKYDFDGNFNGNSSGLFEPIDGKADPRQKLMFGIYRYSTGTTVSVTSQC